MSVCVNNVALIGNLTKDPEARVFDDGNKIVHLGLALNEVANGKEYTTFLDIELRGQPADFAGSYLRKGDLVYIQGSLRSDSWVDRTTGQRRTKIFVRGFRCVSLRASSGSTSRESSTWMGNERDGERGGEARLPPRPDSDERPPVDHFEPGLPF